MVIHVVTDDPAVPLDLPAWCHLTGHDYLGPVNLAAHHHVRLACPDALPVFDESGISPYPFVVGIDFAGVATVPMPFAGLRPHGVPGADLLRASAPNLDETSAFGGLEHLSGRMGVSRRARVERMHAVDGYR
jgi:hypothetical protein